MKGDLFSSFSKHQMPIEATQTRSDQRLLATGGRISSEPRARASASG